MNELGTPRKPDSLGMPAMPMNPDAGKVEYPTLRLNGEQAELAGFQKCAFGDEYTVTMKLRVKRVGGDSYEMRSEEKPPIEFDVIAADSPVEAESEAEDEGESEKEESKEVKREKPRAMGAKEAGFSTEPDEEDED